MASLHTCLVINVMSHECPCGVGISTNEAIFARKNTASDFTD